jgi:hypothetical protein
MTTICFASIKGAPGVTTLATLVGATWPSHRRAVVAECDPSGGDLAVRFRLSAKCGWSSFAAASRRLDGPPPLLPHLQSLPGGLLTLIGPRSPLAPESMPKLIDLAIEAASRDDAWDLLVDLGRLPLDGPSLEWLARADAVVIVTGTDASSVLHVHDRADRLLSRCSGRLGLVLVEGVGYRGEEIEHFTGIPVMGQIPHDVRAAAALGGRPNHRRRLIKSSLLRSGQAIALDLGGEPASVSERGVAPDESEQPLPGRAPSSPSSIGGRALVMLRRLAMGHPGLVRSVDPSVTAMAGPIEDPVQFSNEQVAG